MRDELTCWDYLHEFTGQQAALAIVGEPLSDDPKNLAKTLPVLERMRQSYEGTLQWFTAGPDLWEIAPAKYVLIEPNLQSPLPPPIAIAPRREAPITDATSDTERVNIHRNWLEYERAKLPCLPQILKTSNPQNPLPSIELQQAISSIDAATSDVTRSIIFHRRMERLSTDESDFDRQYFSRTVLARWVDEVGARSLYSFAVTVNAETPNQSLAVSSDSNDISQDQERRLARLRALGGNARFKRGEWKFKGITELVNREKSEGYKRSDEKTIRNDLREAAENERDAKRAGPLDGLGKR